MYFFHPKGIIIPNTERLNNYSTEEGANKLKVSQKWGTIVYSVNSNNLILKTVRVFDGFMALESNGRAYKPGITEQVITIDEFIKEYSALCVVKVMNIREVMFCRN